MCYKYKKFIQVAKNNLENKLLNMDNEIQLNKRICEDKQAYHAIAKVQEFLDKLNELLLDQGDCSVIILTRVVDGYNQLAYNMNKSKSILKTVHFKVIFLLNNY